MAMEGDDEDKIERSPDYYLEQPSSSIKSLSEAVFLLGLLALLCTNEHMINTCNIPQHELNNFLSWCTSTWTSCTSLVVNFLL